MLLDPGCNDQLSEPIVLEIGGLRARQKPLKQSREPCFENFGKRMIKSPKYYFTDTGLLCYLLNIEKEEQVLRDPLVGHLFENLVILEALKSRYNQGLSPNLYFSRDSEGHEIDLLWLSGGRLNGFEIKSASTWTSGFKKELLRFSDKVAPLATASVVYNGDAIEFSDGVRAVHYTETGSLFHPSH